MPSASATTAATSGPSMKPATSNAASRPRLAPTASGSRVITMRRIAGPTAPLPSPSSSRATRNAQNSVASALPIMAPIARTIPPRTSSGAYPRSARRASASWVTKPARNPAATITPSCASEKP